MMFEPTDLAEAHRKKPPLPDSLVHEEESGILVRYDGMTRQEYPVIFAVMDIDDVAKLPADLFDRIGLAPEPGTVNAANPHAFCVESPDQTMLCLDTDAYGGFLQDLFARVRKGELSLFVAQGDLKLMCDEAGDITPPQQPAFIRNGCRPVSGAEANARITQLREAGYEHDDSSLSPG